jgi:hypothetical protein
MKKIADKVDALKQGAVVKKAVYKAPEVRATTGKASMSGAGCPTHTVQWQQVSCKC